MANPTELTLTIRGLIAASLEIRTAVEQGRGVDAVSLLERRDVVLRELGSLDRAFDPAEREALRELQEEDNRTLERLKAWRAELKAALDQLTSSTHALRGYRRSAERSDALFDREL